LKGERKGQRNKEDNKEEEYYAKLELSLCALH
jgi:hypothetical protein